jgi:histidinol-phosphate aminotransferase
MPVKNPGQLVQQLIRSDVQEMQAYAVPDASGMEKLDAMENPFRFPPEDAPESLKSEWQQALLDVSMNRYPDPGARDLVAAIRNHHQLGDDVDVLLGNGSDELIQLLIQAVASDDAVVLAPDPGFVMYRILADINRVEFCGVQLLPDFSLDLDAMLRVIADKKPALLFLARPNNPTGNVWPLDDIRSLIEASTGLVIIDEAYMAFTDADATPLMESYPNVLVLRTLSKVGLAGLRLGYLLGSPSWIHELNKVRMPYNINVFTQVAATFALQHFSCFSAQTELLVQERQYMSEQLKKVEGVEVFASEANFLLLRVPEGRALSVFSRLKEDKVLIKSMSGGHPLLEDCLRVTVGTRRQNERFIEVFLSALKC